MTGKRRTTLLALMLLFGGVVGSGYAVAEDEIGSSSLAPMPGNLVGNLQRGGRLFLAHCVTCHGEAGNGQGPRAAFLDPKPRNFLTEAFREKFSRPRIFTTVALGKLSTQMPAWLKTLPEQDVADVSEYVFQRFVLKTTDLASR